ADFGIARMAVGEGTLTEAGTVLGTAAYISPEQATGESASAASDVYSFGVILFRMLTGRLPFESNDPMALVLQHRDTPPPPIAAPLLVVGLAGGALAYAMTRSSSPAPTGTFTGISMPSTKKHTTSAATTTAPPPTTTQQTTSQQTTTQSPTTRPVTLPTT